MTRRDDEPRLVRDPAGRTPPNALDAELAVLEAAIRTGEIADVRDLLPAEAWFSDANRTIWEACCAVIDRGAPIDVIAVKHQLETSGTLQRAGGAVALGRIFDLPVSGRPRDHALLVARKHRLRKMIARAQLVAAEGYGDVGDDGTWCRTSADDLDRLARMIPDGSAVGLAPGVDKAIGTAVNAIGANGAMLGLSTGLAQLDEATAGLHGNDLVVVTAKSGGGKTALACHLARQVAAVGRGVAFMSVEMPADQISTRIVCSEASVSWHAVRLGRATKDDVDRLIAVRDAVVALPIVIDHNREDTIRSLIARARNHASDFAKAKTPIGLVIVDYFQLVNCDSEYKRGENPEKGYGRAAKLLLGLSEELNCTVLALAQMNATGDIRDCKAIGHTATSWWNLALEDSDAVPRTASIEINKQRHAPKPKNSPATYWWAPWVSFCDTNPRDGAPPVFERWCAEPGEPVPPIQERNWHEPDRDESF